MSFKFLKIKILRRFLRGIRKRVDLIRGLNFSDIDRAHELGFTDPDISRSSPSGDIYLINVLKYLEIVADDSIIDLGCGRGSAMRIMLKFKFKNIHGIELSDKIAAIAENNFQILKAKQIQIFHGNVTQFDEYSCYNFFYLANPFKGELMELTLQLIISSLKRNPRIVTIIYNNPTCHQSIINSGAFKMVKQFPNKWKTNINVYHNFLYLH
jgi:hypothetical protein